MNEPRAYIAGPMRGFDRWNFPAFDEARDSLTALGWDIISPADMDRDLGLDENATTLPDWFTIEGALKRDFAAITTSNAIVLLPGWERSSGANAELRVARWIGLDVYGYEPGTDHLVARRPGTVIGLAGYARSGKDTIGAELVQHHGFRRLAFADRVKQAALAVNPYVSMSDCRRLDEVIATDGWNHAKSRPEIRRLLQRLGTEAGRDIHGPDIWTEAATRDLYSSSQPTVFTDVRFPSEVAFLSSVGGQVVRLHRDGAEALFGHASETEVAALNALDVKNDSTPAEVAAHVLVLVGAAPA